MLEPGEKLIHKNPGVATTREMFEHPNRFCYKEPCKGAADVAIQIEARIENGECSNLNCPQESARAVRGPFCKPCADELEWEPPHYPFAFIDCDREGCENPAMITDKGWLCYDHNLKN